MPPHLALTITWPHDPVEWIGAIAAILAAVFGALAIRDAREANRVAAENRRLELEPRLHWQIDHTEGGHLDVRISNAGGAVQRAYFRLQKGALVYEIGNFQIPAQSPLIPFEAHWVASGPLIDGCVNVLLVCQGTDGRWWDWTRGMPEPLADPPGQYPTSAEFRAWLAPRLERRAEEVVVEDATRRAVRSPCADSP